MSEVRKFQQNELIEYAYAHRHAGDWKDDELDPNDTSWIDPGSAWGVFADGAPVSVLRNIPFRQSVRGVEKSMGGIAGVATVPHYRRRGYVRQLMAAAFDDMRQKGQVVSTLYPFKASFYTTFGYISANPNLRVRIPGECLTHHLPIARNLPGTWQVDLAKMSDVRDKIYTFQRDTVIPRVNGYVIDPDRPQKLWQARSKDTLTVFVRRNGVTEALARYWIENSTLYVDEIHWHSPEARVQLLSYLALYRDQAPTVWLRNLPLGINLHAWLQDSPINLNAQLVETPMIRVMEPAKTLKDLPANPTGTIDFALRDEQCPWNSGIYRVTAREGRLAAGRNGDSESPALKLSIQGLTALVYGVLPLEEAIFRGWISGLDIETHDLLTAWFPPTPFFNPYHF